MVKKPKNVIIKKKKGESGMDFKSKKGFGINEIIGISAGVIIAAIVVIPGLMTFAQTVMNELTTWWAGVSSSLFS